MNNDAEHIAPIELLTKFLAGEASEKESEQVKAWCDASPDNLKEFEAIKTLWNYTNSPALKQEIDLDKEWQRMENTISPAKTRSLNFGRILAVAASVAALAILSVVGYQQTQLESFKTGIAETKEIKLPDGSVVNLNANTKLTYHKNFNKKNRELQLKGEAYFKVTKNKELPFIISANETKIQVVGTQFNVRAYKKYEEVKVTVLEGTVKLYDAKIPKKETLIKAGETGSFERSTKAIEKIPETDINDMAWKTRIIEFDNTSMEGVAQVLSNTYHVDIEVSDAIKTCTIDVRFDNEEFTEVIKVIKSTLGIRSKVVGERLILYGDGC